MKALKRALDIDIDLTVEEFEPPIDRQVKKMKKQISDLNWRLKRAHRYIAECDDWERYCVWKKMYKKEE